MPAEFEKDGGARATVDLPQVSRVTRSKAQARAAYDRLSSWYDLLAEPFEGKYRRVGLDLLAPRPGEWLLELGPGTGHGLFAIGSLIGPSGMVCGLDLSMGMLQRSQRLLERERLLKTVKLQCGDAVRLPYRPDTFNAVFTSFTLELFDTPEIPSVLAECRRVLKSEGRLVAVALAKQARPNLITRMYEWFHDRFPQYADCRPILIQRDLEAAGFQIMKRLDFSMAGLPGAALLARI